jgi:uncharacterized protein YbjT (DUF2867 family)
VSASEEEGAERRGSVLLLGASGFIGTPLRALLENAGFRVVTASRRPASSSGAVQADFAVDHDPQAWLPRLEGIDAVINAVGIFTERGSNSYHAIHTAAPQALFAACARAGVPRVIQISALGAESGITGYFRSKLRADEYLMGTPLDWTIVRPSLVYGDAGASSRILRMLASLPLIPLPGNGSQQVQPIHVEDLARAIVAMLAGTAASRAVVPVVGPVPLPFRNYLLSLRKQMGLRPGLCMPTPRWLMHIAGVAGGRLAGGLLRPDSIAMLELGSTADPRLVTALLGQAPRPASRFIGPGRAAGLRMSARLAWLLPLLRLSIAALWILSGIVSLWFYPREASFAMLAQAGIPAALRLPALYGAGSLDLLMGLACLWPRPRSWVWLGQIVLVLVYTAIITLRLPELWLHPFGPISKNLPILAALLVLYFQARDRWNT